jgi:hypothetical protein
MRRLDHGAMYVCVTLGLWCWAVSLLVYGPTQLSAIQELSITTQNWLATSVFFGATIKTVGFCSGTRFFMPNLDMRRSLLLGIIGVPLVSTSVAVFFFAVLYGATNPVLSGLGSALSLFIPVGGYSNAIQFQKERMRITRNMGVLRAQETQMTEDVADYDDNNL